MKKLSILTVIIFLYSHSFAQTNGYTLEFEDVVTLSVDALTAPATGATITKSYTVPSGMVLKINSGRISIYRPVGTTTITTGYIKVDDNLIMGVDTSINGIVVSSGGTPIASGSIYRIKPDQPIWAPSGSIVTLGVAVGTMPSTSFPLFTNWFSGVLLRKVAN